MADKATTTTTKALALSPSKEQQQQPQPQEKQPLSSSSSASSSSSSSSSSCSSSKNDNHKVTSKDEINSSRSENDTDNNNNNNNKQKNTTTNNNNNIPTFLLAINAMLNIPMYLMLICFTIFILLVMYAPYLWMKTLLLAYFIYGIVGDSKPHGIKPKWIRDTMQPIWNKSWSVRMTAKYFDCQIHKTCNNLQQAAWTKKNHHHQQQQTKNKTNHYENDNDNNNSNEQPNDETNTTCNNNSDGSAATKSEQYIFSYHPHGVISMGAGMGLITDACGFNQVFPEVPHRSGVTLNATFWVPFFREWLLYLGLCSANKSTLIRRLLDQESIVLVPGGAVEALHAHPKVMKFCIQHRKGFIKLALETNSPIVPCIGFGENDIFDTIYNHPNHHHHHYCPNHQDDGTEDKKRILQKQASSSFSSSSSSSSGMVLKLRKLVWKLQHAFQKQSSFSVPIWTNLVPKRGPIHVVVGTPLRFDDYYHSTENDTNDNNNNNNNNNNIKVIPQKTVDECHAMYLQAVQELYDTHKAKYGYESVPLEFI